MNYILITNLDRTGLDTLICSAELDQCDVLLMLIDTKREFDDVKEIQEPQVPPPNTTVSWYTPRGEYDIKRNIALKTPGLAEYYPEWEVLHPKRRR